MENLNNQILNNEILNNEILNCEELVILKFYSTYCAPCKQLEIEFENIDLKNIKTFNINILENMEIAFKYEITSVPTLVFIKNNKILEKVNGFINKDEILKIINKRSFYEKENFK